MDSFYDKYGRDRVIMDWLRRYKPELMKIYDGILARRFQYEDLNALILFAFEVGIDFSRASKRDPRLPPEVKNEQIG